MKHHAIFWPIWTAAIIAAAILLEGCAWSHYENGTIECWTIVVGKGRLGADCGEDDAQLASEDTGFSDNAAKTFRSMGEAFGTGLGAAARTAAGAP